MMHFCYLDSGVVVKGQLKMDEIKLEAAKRFRDLLDRYIEDPATYSDDLEILVETEGDDDDDV